MPRPIQPGGPRVMVGGGGEQRTLRIAAKHADMTHWFPLGLEVLRHKTEVLAVTARRSGGIRRTIELTMAAPVVVAGERRRGGGDPRPPAAGTAARSSRPAHPSRWPTRSGRTSTLGSPGSPSTTRSYRTPEAIGRVGELLRLIGVTAQ